MEQKLSQRKHLSLLCSIPEQAVGCYCCLLEQERSPEQPEADGNGYVICFMGGSEKGLNLYPFVEADKVATSILCVTKYVLLHYHCFLIKKQMNTKPFCFTSLTKDTFRLELDKYVQGLHSSLQTPEV